MRGSQGPIQRRPAGAEHRCDARDVALSVRLEEEGTDAIKLGDDDETVRTAITGGGTGKGGQTEIPVVGELDVERQPVAAARGERRPSPRRTSA